MIPFIFTGVGNWERYAYPLIRSIQLHDDGLDIYCVNSGPEMYPELEGVNLLYSIPVLPYAVGLNKGLKIAPKSKFYIISNDDVLLRKRISDRIEQLSPALLYGFYLHKFMGKFDYLSGWCLIISEWILKKVGYFDEAFTPMFFEDADFSLRCQRAGIELSCLDREEWGIYHIQDERMQERKDYIVRHQVERDRNRAYLRQKHGL